MWLCGVVNLVSGRGSIEGLLGEGGHEPWLDLDGLGGGDGTCGKPLSVGK